MRERKLAVLISTSLLLLPAVALSAGLGALTVRSAPGEPLQADIQLEQVTPAEIGNLQAQLATPDVFHRANVPWDPVIEQITLSIGSDAQGHPVLHLTAPAPINRPSIDLLIQLSGPDGTVVREYPVTLAATTAQLPASTPAVPAAPAVASAPAAVSAPAVPAAAAAPAVPASTSATPSIAPEDTDSSRSPRTLDVHAGDTLSGLAEQVRPDGITLDQMLAALYETNRQAFRGHNMNRLMAGRILRVPDITAVKHIDTRAALDLVRHQEVAWHHYRQALAGAAPLAQAPGGADRSAASGGITVATPAPAAQVSRDVLRVSRGDKAGDARSAQSRSDRIAALQEELTARKEALQEADSRVADLEKNVKEMQQLLALKDRDMARLQQQAAQAKAKPAVKPAAVPAAPAAAKPRQPDSASSNRMWGVVGGVVAGLFGLGLWLLRRRRLAADGQEPAFQETLEAVRRREMPADPVAAARQLLEQGEVDAAEELLTEALSRERHRADVMLLLMEIYTMRGNPSAFLALARQYQAVHPGQDGPLWPQIAAMGRNVDPDNPLYREAVAVTEAPISLDEIPSFTAAPAVVPSVETIAEPAGVADEPAADAVAAPATEAAAAPATEAVAAPATEAVAAPATDAAAAPVTDAAAPPATDAVAAPATDAVAAPATDTVATPATDTVATPATDEAAPPAADRVAEPPADRVAEPVADAAAALPADMEDPPASTPTAAADADGKVDLDFGFRMDEDAASSEAEAAAEAPAELPPLDFSGIDLNLNGASAADAQTTAATDSAQTEAATKLDLARAYLEMGDSLGARQVLNEVIREGNAAQVLEAQALLAQQSA